ncbi:hypothetical protein AJ78_02263 [Emergomyces pasteurianus Ep9510]|uniref:DUF1993 domain-containing protein n=1 Tax=Emergomyces pasteurianus Ep9510 TaxID=1447872 RepID=A0A1J9PMF1_9EURO|nr:hypothetical protein AJ78_02263 [Emergomyces pasteurianus Ep9510]
MPLSTYDASVGLLVSGLGSLQSILAKAEEHAKSKEINPDDYVQLKLYEDMKALDFQVHSAVDTSTKCAARLLGIEPLEWKSETTFAGLQKQVADGLAYLKKVAPDAVEGKETKTITMGIGPGKSKDLPAKNYISGYSIPNFFFHLQTAYALLRHNGVPLNKGTYISAFMA